MRGRRIRSERGQGLVEYGLILAAASVGVVVALLILRDSLGNTYASTRARISRCCPAPASPANAPTDGGVTVGQPPGGDPSTSDPSSAGGDNSGGQGHGHGNGQGNSGNGNGNGGPNGRKD